MASSLGKQFSTLKDNWLIILLVFIALLVVVGAPLGVLSPTSLSARSGGYAPAMSESAYDSSARYGGIPAPYPGGSFAPEIEERQITKSGSLSTEIARGSFDASVSQFKQASTGAKAIILNENVQIRRDANGKTAGRTGYYSLRVPATAYDSLVSQLKGIGTVQSYSESTDDITGSYTSLEDELAAEKSRMAQYQKMLAQPNLKMEDQLSLTDRIFNQQRTIDYLTKALSNQDERVAYSTLSFTLDEKTSEFASLKFASITELVRNFLGSLNSLFVFISYILPWVIGGGLLWAVIHLVRKRMG